MSVIAAFNPQTKQILLATNGTPSTANSTNITQANLGLSAAPFPYPPQILIVNTGTANVFVSFTTATAVIAAPTSGAANGTTSLLLLPNAPLIFTWAGGPTLWVNDISTAASQNYYFVLGEGL